MRIALFGGSFDPPHLGHVFCATFAWAVGGVDEVWVLPVAEHPYGKRLLAWEDRWQLCRDAFDGLGFVRLRDDERDNPGGKTFNLVRKLRAAHPDHRWYLLSGTDALEDLPNWYCGEELARMVEVIAVPRRGYDDAHPAALPAISSTLLRRRLAAGEPIDELVPKAVAARIAAEGWYRDG